MKSILSLVVLAVFVSLANGHGWLIYPAPRGSDLGVGTSSNASTSAPCGQQGEYRDSDVVTVENLGRLAVSYQTENGHAGNQPDTCTFSLSRTQTGFSTLAGPFPCTPAIYHRNITVFAPDADNGTYYLQFRWRAADGSNWYNCAKLRILAVDLDVAPIIEGVNEVLVPLVTRLYMLNVTAGSFVYIAVGGPVTGSVEVLASLNTIPTPGNKDRNVTVLANQRSAISFCATGQAGTLYFAVTTSEASSGPVLILPSTYSAFTDYTNPKPQITDTLPRGGSKLYSFLSYSTPDIPKRIVLTAPAGTGLSQTVGNQCTSKVANPDTIVGSSGPACLDMTTTQGNKYLEVSVPGGSLVSFSVTLEAGKCKDLASSAIHLTASFLLVALAFLLAL